MVLLDFLLEFLIFFFTKSSIFDSWKANCDTVCDSANDLVLHWEAKHDDSKEQLDCSICDKVFKTQKQLIQHEYDEHKIPKYRCDKCDMWFDSFASFRTHSKYHQEGQIEKSVCILCQKEFDHSNLLVSHMLKNHVTNGEYKCDFCTKTFKTDRRSELEFHVTKDHGIGDYKFKCDICDLPFAKECRLKKHKDVVHEKKSLNLICDTCGLVCKTKTHFDKHLKLKGQTTGIHHNICPNIGFIIDFAVQSCFARSMRAYT